MMDDSAPSAPITVRIREACRLTGIGRSKLYMLIGEGYIETVKVGSMTLVTMRSLEAFLLGGAKNGQPPAAARQFQPQAGPSEPAIRA